MMIRGEQATCTHIADKKLKLYYHHYYYYYGYYYYYYAIVCTIILLYLCFAKHRCMSPSVNMHDLAMHAEWNRWFYAIGAAYHNTYGSSKKLVEQVGKIISTKMNGDVGMAGW